MTDPTIVPCAQALRLLAEYLDGELPSPEHGGVRDHLEVCRACHSRAELELRLRAQLAELGRYPVRSAFEQRVRALIGRFPPRPGPASADG